MKSKHDRHKKKRSAKAGLSPGTLVHVGEQRSESVRIQIIDYNPSGTREIEVKSPQECFPLRPQASVTWINVDGLHELEVIEQIGTRLHLHPLTLEDVVNTEQRPKLEEFEDYIFIVLRMFQFEPQSTELKSEQLSLVLGRSLVLSFQEWPGGYLRSRAAEDSLRKGEDPEHEGRLSGLCPARLYRRRLLCRSGRPGRENTGSGR